MKITIKEDKFNLNFYLPTFFLKTKAFTKLIIKNEDIHIPFKDYYHVLSNYSKKNGHFDLVEIESENTKIIIRI